MNEIIVEKAIETGCEKCWFTLQLWPSGSVEERRSDKNFHENEKTRTKEISFLYIIKRDTVGVFSC